MSATLLTKDEHKDLLEKLTKLSSAEAPVYRQKLEDLYEKYNDQIVSLFLTISAYEEIANHIKLKITVKDN